MSATAATARAIPRQTGPSSRADAVARAQALVPELRLRAAQTDSERNIPDESIRAIRDAGLFRVCAPAVFGGSQLGIAALIETVATIASGCGSTGWVYGVLAGHNWMASLFPPDAQRDVFADENSLIASVVRLGGQPPRKVADGYLFEDAAGKYCSGVAHADWIMVGAGVAGEGGAPEQRYFLIPKSEVEIVDDWFTIGLRGTRSNSLTIKRALVPVHRSVSIAEMARGTAPGILFHNSPVYRAPFPQVLPFPLAGVPIGLARAALGVYLENYGGKLAGFSEEQVAEQGAVFARISDAHADTEAAAALLFSDAVAMDELADGSKASALDRARFVRDVAYSAHKCRLAVTSLFEASGGSAVYDGFELQRIWRDVNAAAAHNSFVRDRAGPMFGRAILGLPPSKFDRIGH